MQVENSTLHDRARLFARIPPCIDLSTVANCPSETETYWRSNEQPGKNFNKPLHIKTNVGNVTSVKIGADDLPIDPRDWTRREVKMWIMKLGKLEGFDWGHIAENFKMNGKALCLMSVEMFLSRFPAGGKLLYRDFRLRLTYALSL